MTGRRRWWVAAALVVALVAGACGGDDDGGDGEDAGGQDPATSTTAAGDVAVVALDTDRVHEVVETLAADDLEGRDNQSPGSEQAQAYLVEQLAEFTEPLGGSDLDGYGHPFAAGTNLLGLIPGTDRAEEHLVIGAHYDGLGHDCNGVTAEDDICNGAADNAAGVAVVLEVGRALAAEEPSRSVVVALWDAEEDGLLGAEAYLADPPVPQDDTIAYLNWDIQGTNLSPSLTEVTVMVGAETGGPNLTEAALAATEASSLQTLDLSLLFGQGRSDHAPFAAAGVPVVFFTDANNGCYHTVTDDLDHLDVDKLDQQLLTAAALAQDLVATDQVPEFVPDLPSATFADAESMLEVVSSAEADFGSFTPDFEALAEQFLVDLTAIVEAGEAAFDDEAVATLLGGSVDIVEALSTGPCDGFLD
jgi:hypothetical protein